jgi:xylose isomerase
VYLGIDLGTSSVKAVLVDDAQRVIGSATAALEVQRPHPLWSEQDPESWWTATRTAIGTLRERAPAEFSALCGIGLSGQMHGATLLDARDRPLRPAILWNDGRSAVECVELERRAPESRRITGNLAMPGFTAPKLLWVAEHEPAVFARVARVLLPKDYLRLCLSGEHASDVSDAAGTLWLDVGARSWSEVMLAASRLSLRNVPRLVEGSEPAGTLRRELAAEWGLGGGIPIAGGAGDQAAGAAGVGVIRPGQAFLSLGTSGVLFAATDAFAPYPEGGVHTFCHCLPATWHQMSVILSAASCLSWLAAALGARSEAELLAEVEATERRSGLLFLGARGRGLRPRRRPVRAPRRRSEDRVARRDRRRRAQPLLGAHPGECTRATPRVRGGRRGRPRVRRSTARAPGRHRRGGDRGLHAAAGRHRHRARSSAARRLSDRAANLSKHLRRASGDVPARRDLMSEPFFTDVERIRYEGPDTDNPLAYRFYDPDRVVLGVRMEDQLRLAVCYWHTFCWPGTDVFGAGTFVRPWLNSGTPLEQARRKLEVAFEFFEKLGTPFFTFHDRDVAPEGANLAETHAHLDAMLERMEHEMARTGVRLLWGTANLFSHPRYAAGAATNPDPDVFAYAAAQVRKALDATHRLGGANYVLWGGREGYDTLLNTDLRREADQLGRFMYLVVEHKHKIGFQGSILIEPKPMEPTKHQYDFDAAAVYAFLQKYGLEREIRVNIEANHATLAGHSFHHELAYAIANDIFGSVDVNRGDPQLGWDTDQFPNSVEESTLSLYLILQGGGIGTGGFNFDAKLRRQSLDPIDLFHAHIGGVDTLARGLLNAGRIIEDGRLKRFVERRYARWDEALGREILAGKRSLANLSDHVVENEIEPTPVSGRQELLENLINRFL